MSEPLNWMIWDLTRAESDNPAFGPMSESEAKAFASRSPNYRAHPSSWGTK